VLPAAARHMMKSWQPPAGVGEISAGAPDLPAAPENACGVTRADRTVIRITDFAPEFGANAPARPDHGVESALNTWSNQRFSGHSATWHQVCSESPSWQGAVHLLGRARYQQARLLKGGTAPWIIVVKRQTARR
jgi:hypothetical protein